MTSELQRLVVTEVSLVDEPANKDARVILMKRGDGDEKASLARSVLKALGLSKADLPDEDNDGDDDVEKDAEKQLAELREANEKLTKQVAELVEKAEKAEQEAVAKADAEKVKAEKASKQKAFREKLSPALQKAFDEMDDEEREAFMASRSQKSADEDPVAKAIADLEKRNADLEKRVHEAETAGHRAEVLKSLKGVPEAEKVADEFMALAKHDEDAAKAMLDRVVKLAEQVKTAGLFKTIGRDGRDTGSAETKLEALAKERVAKGAGQETFEQAYDAVLKENPDLYEQVLAEKEAN